MLSHGNWIHKAEVVGKGTVGDCLGKCWELGSGCVGQHGWPGLGYSQRRYSDSISSGEKKDAENKDVDWQ